MGAFDNPDGARGGTGPVNHAVLNPRVGRTVDRAVRWCHGAEGIFDRRQPVGQRHPGSSLSVDRGLSRSTLGGDRIGTSGFLGGKCGLQRFAFRTFCSKLRPHLYPATTTNTRIRTYITYCTRVKGWGCTKPTG